MCTELLSVQGLGIETLEETRVLHLLEVPAPSTPAIKALVQVSLALQELLLLLFGKLAIHLGLFPAEDAPKSLVPIPLSGLGVKVVVVVLEFSKGPGSLGRRPHVWFGRLRALVGTPSPVPFLLIFRRLLIIPGTLLAFHQAEIVHLKK